jgi:hypothetical protein
MTLPSIAGRLRRSVLGFLLLAAGLAVTDSASAVGTRRFEFDDPDDFLGGDLRGVSIDSQGSVRAGWNLGSMSLTGANSVWCSIVLADGTVLLGTGNTGKVLKVSGGQVSEYADTKQIAVTSIVQGAAGVFAATMPNGKIFKLDGSTATELPAIADAENIWSLAYDTKKNGFYAATGPQGKLFFVQPGGQAQLVFDSDETNLISVAVADDGTVYTGSSGKGLLYKINGPGRAQVLLDAPGDEVKFIYPNKNGSLFVVSNEMGEGGESGGSRGRGGAFAPPSPGRGGGGRVGRGYLLKVESDGRAEELLARKDTHFVSFAVDDAGKPYVGTGAEGRVFSTDDNHTIHLMADVDGRQVGAMNLTGKNKFIVASDPASFHEIRGMGGADATWTSRVLDAGLRATFGKLTWHADGAVEVSMRTGNSSTPDTTWSDWSAPLSAPGKPTSPPGRFVQLRARFSKDANAALHDLSVPFVTDNLRAVVTNIEAKSSRKGSSGTGGGIPQSGSDVPSRASTIKVSWRVDNPDSDQLRYRVQFRFASQSIWRDLTKTDETLTRSEIDWETASLPEGIYHLRVEATDEIANPPDKVTRHTLESGPVLVDNTPPVFRTFTAQGKRLKAEVVDGLGPITRIDFSVDGRTEWRPLAPKDGVFDEPNEEIDVDLSSVVGSGSHLVAVRAYDAAGNYVVRDIELK